jgi:hypothetical protein
MSDASKAFLASPTDFMKKNILVIDDAGMWHVSEDRELDLIPAGSGLSASGTGIPMYRLQKANDRTTDRPEASNPKRRCTTAMTARHERTVAQRASPPASK